MPCASRTPNVTLKVPEVEGTPEIAPVELFKEIPAGSAPATTLQVYGLCPPLALSVAEYATPEVPAGNVDVVIDRGGATTAAIASERFAVVEVPCASRTPNVTLKVPEVEGTPEIAPVELFKEIPAGSAPATTLQVYGLCPPLALSVAEYATPEVPAGNVDVVIDRGGATTAAIASERFAVVEVPCASRTPNVTLKVPEVEGTPEIAPVELFKEIPAGSAPATTLQVYGLCPPLALSVAEYAAPAVPFGNVDVVIDSGVEGFEEDPMTPPQLHNKMMEIGNSVARSAVFAHIYEPSFRRA